MASSGQKLSEVLFTKLFSDKEGKKIWFESQADSGTVKINI
jgi:hypothetical protein